MIAGDNPPPGNRAGNPARFPAPGHRVVASILAIATLVGAILAIRDTSIWGTTYAGAAVDAAIADLAAGLALITVGLYVGADASHRRLGSVLMLAGTAWLAADLVGWQGAWLHLRVLASAAAVMLAPLLLHAVAIAPGERAATPRLGLLIAAGYIAGITLGVMAVLGRDPSSEAACWDLCSANPFLLAGVVEHSASILNLKVVTGIATGAAIAIVAATRLWRYSRVERGAATIILVPGLLVGVLTAARWMAAGAGNQGPNDPAAALLFDLTAISVATLAGGVAISVRARRRMRSAITALARVDPRTALARTAREVLIEATGDPSLTLAYSRSGSDRLIDAHGDPVELSGNEGRVHTRVTRLDELVAVIDHGPRVMGAADLADQLGPAARLALENERLDAELRAQLRELRESRARIVTAADAERRRRERALHDGAQQRLLALTYDLRTAREACANPGFGIAIGMETIAQHLDSAIAAVHAAHDELREVAHGIYPAVLSEAGLRPALESLVERAPFPLRLETDVTTRCGSGGEMTVYVAADELVRDAASRGARHGALRLRVDAGHLRLDMQDDGVAPAGTIDHVADRAGANGGSLGLVEAADGHVVQRVVVPCVSS